MVELGSRGQLELVRAGSDLPPSMGLDQPPDGARHFTNWAACALSLTRKASVKVDVSEETGGEGYAGTNFSAVRSPTTTAIRGFYRAG